MKLLVDARPITDPAKGGVGRVALELVDAYAAAFPDDQIVCVTTGSRRPALPERLTAHANLTHRHIAIPNKIWSALSMLGFASLVHDEDAAFYPNLGFIGRIPPHAVLLLHDLSFLIEPRWFRWKQRLWHRAIRADRMIRSFPRLLAVSETTKRDAIRLLGIPAERLTVIPIGLTLHASPDRFVGEDAPSSRSPAFGGMPKDFDERGSAGNKTIGTRRLFALGGNDPRKNHATVKIAVERLREDPSFKNVELIIPTGRPTDEELATLYKNASAFVYPSWYEGFGLPLHEAAQFGTPCIASTAGALPETAPPGTLFANPAKPHQWVEALRTILDTPRGPEITPDPTAWTRAVHLLRSAVQH